jgi:hypothetical protein
MRLESEGAAPVSAPTPEQVDACLRRVQLEDSGFAILEDVISAFQSYLRQNGAWRSVTAWQPVDVRARPARPRVHRQQRRMRRSRVFARLGIGLGWFVVQALILLALFVVGGEIGGLGYLVSPDDYAAPLAVGFIIGLLAGLWVDYQLPRWLFQRRLEHLRRAGVRVDATIDWVEAQYAASSGGTALRTYTVFVSWQAADAQIYQLERQSRFWGSSWRRFEAAVAGATVPVAYEPARPARFMLDLPFAPSMADYFLS